MPRMVRYAANSFVIVLAFTLGCGQSHQSSVDRKGIITMAPHLTETVFALGQGGRVIAVGSFDDYPPEVASLPKVYSIPEGLLPFSPAFARRSLALGH